MQSLKYSVNTVLTCIIFCVLLQVHGYHIFAGFIFFGGVKQKPEIRQCSQATASVTILKAIRLRDVLMFLASV